MPRTTVAELEARLNDIVDTYDADINALKAALEAANERLDNAAKVVAGLQSQTARKTTPAATNRTIRAQAKCVKRCDITFPVGTKVSDIQEHQKSCGGKTETPQGSASSTETPQETPSTS